jgi:hypothetical protein
MENANVAYKELLLAASICVYFLGSRRGVLLSITPFLAAFPGE